VIDGRNSPKNSIASSKQGSLQEKHIVFCQARHDRTSISILTSISFLFSKAKTPLLQAFAHISQYVQPLREKSRVTVSFSKTLIIFSSQAVMQGFYLHFIQFVKKRFSSLKYGGRIALSCSSFFEKGFARELKSSLLCIIYLTPSSTVSIRFEIEFKPSLLKSGTKLFTGTFALSDCGA
jgi:hypothetical protein